MSARRSLPAVVEGAWAPRSDMEKRTILKNDKRLTKAQRAVARRIAALTLIILGFGMLLSGVGAAMH